MVIVHRTWWLEVEGSTHSSKGDLFDVLAHFYFFNIPSLVVRLVLGVRVGWVVRNLEYGVWIIQKIVLQVVWVVPS